MIKSKHKKKLAPLISNNNGSIHLENDNSIGSTIWYHYLKNFGFNSAQVDDIVNKNSDRNFTIIEVGSERGVGSTYHLGKYCLDNNLNFITIDASEESNKSAKNILKKFPFLEFV